MKTKNFTPIAAILFVLALGQSTFAGPWPELETDQQKLEYGLALRSKIKPFFTGTYNYGMEWWNIATDQQKIKHALNGLYPKELDTRPLNVITLNKVIDKDVPSAEQMEIFKNSMLEYLAQQPTIANRAELIHQLDVRVSALQSIKPGDLLSQLMNSFTMDPKDRQTILKSSNAEKIAYLRQHLPDDLSQTQISKVSKNRYTPEMLGSKNQALDKIEKLFAAEREIVPLLGLTVFTDRLPVNASRGEIEKAVAQVNNEQFVTHQSDEVAVEALKKAFRGIQKAEATAVETAQFSGSVFSKSMQKLAAAGTQKVKVEAPYLQLVEKPRDEAIMRSAVANDCTHTCSFTKADDPNSRIFYLVDVQQNKELGYIESEIKASNMGDVLYLSSINGPTITPEQAEEILYMLSSHTRELGVKQLTIAGRNLSLHMNYADVINYLEKQIDGKPRMQVHSKNQAIASVIDGFLKVDYQKEHENTEAVPYTPEQRLGHVRSTYSQKADTSNFHHKIEPKEVLLFALEMDSTERWVPQAGQLSDGERAIAAAKMNLDQYRTLRSTLQNRGHLPYEKFMEVAHNALKPYGVEVDKAFVNEHPHLFYDALLASSDAVEGPLRKTTLKLAAQIIKRGMWHATWGLKEFGKNPQNLEAINSSKEIEDVMRWASSDLGFHSIQVRNMVSAGIGFPALRKPEMTRELFKLVGHGHMWAPDLATEILKAIYPDLVEKVIPQYQRDSDPQVRDGANKLMQTLPKPAVVAKDFVSTLKSPTASRPGYCSKVFSTHK